MVVFINDHSLGGFADWLGALRLCRSTVAELAAAKVSCAVHRDRDHFMSPAFKQRFNHLALPSDEKAVLRELAFSEKHYPCWRPGRRSPDDVFYECENPAMICLDDTVSEAAERSAEANESPVVLLSARQSSFEGLDSITVRKDAAVMQPFVVVSIDRFRRHLAELPGQYDPHSASAPRDFQTVLMKDAARFAFTGKLERKNKRRVFVERNTGRYFYVDEGHPGPTAHLEVFSPIHEHLGTADIHTGTLDDSKKKPRQLRF